MKLSIVLSVAAVCCMTVSTEAWLFGGGSHTSSSSSSSSSGSGSKSSGGAVDFVVGAAKGTAAMVKAYTDMREANWKNSDKYFHARGNADAAKNGAGGRWAAETISNAREWVDQHIKGDNAASSKADQEANKWGRNGGDPNKYRPNGLPDKY